MADNQSELDKDENDKHEENLNPVEQKEEVTETVPAITDATKDVVSKNEEISTGTQKSIIIYDGSVPFSSRFLDELSIFALSQEKCYFPK